MADKSNAPIIIRRVEEDGHGDHHGGGWKVAYADFMTALMAFFLLLWILAASDEEKLRGLANYFTPTVSKTGKAAGSGSDIRPLVSPGVLRDGGAAEGGAQGPTFGEGDPMRVFDSRLRDAPERVVVEYLPAPAPEETSEADGATASGGETEAGMTEAELQQIAQSLEQRLAEEGRPEALAESVRVSYDGEALIFDLVDIERRSLFARGSSDILPDGRALIDAIVASVAEAEGAIEIVGHTDAAQYSQSAGYTNWDLSTDRANVARRLLVDGGLSPARFGGIRGVADTQPANTADPFAAENRRISIRVSTDN